VLIEALLALAIGIGPTAVIKLSSRLVLSPPYLSPFFDRDYQCSNYPPWRLLGTSAVKSTRAGARNGALTPPARFFPCSSTGVYHYEVNKDNSVERRRDNILGRAFLQAAFFDIEWDSGKQYIAQVLEPKVAGQVRHVTLITIPGRYTEGPQNGLSRDVLFDLLCSV
jgi:hypothetical protein